MREKRKRLGVVAISYNEEKDIPYFLENLLPWVDEIVIVDDGSTDNTENICRRAGEKVKFISHPTSIKDKDFAKQRNIGIEHCTADWILNLDIDMRIPPETAKEILKAIDSDKYVAYRIKSINFFLNRPIRYGGWSNWNKAWLAKRGFIKFKNKIHEEEVILADKSRIGQIKNPIWHLGDEDFSERLRKNSLYSKLTAEELIKRYKKVGVKQLLFHPLWVTFKRYILQRGYREGILGLILALYTLSGTINWWIMAWDLQNKISREEIEEELKKLWKGEGIDGL